MKKVIISFIIIVLIILIGWILKDITILKSNAISEKRFEWASEESYFSVVYDKKTKVLYAVSTGQYNKGVVTLLVDADGKPLLYEEGE